MSNINLNNVRVDDQSGRVSFSGIQSGIDTETAVRNIITAKRIPIDRIETQIDQNRQIIAGLSDWRTLMSNLQEQAGKLYGEITVGNSNDVFATKQAFANSSRTDGGAASDPGALIGVTLDNDAELAVHEFEILSRASRMEIAMTGTINLNDSLATVFPGPVPPAFGSSSFEIRTDNASTAAFGSGDLLQIDVNSGDSLLDIAQKINQANQGEFASGVSAQVVQTGSTTGYLVLRADTAGETIETNLLAGDNLLEYLNIVDDTAGATVTAATAATDYANIVSEAGQAQIALQDVLDAESGVFSEIYTSATETIITANATETITINDLEFGAGQLDAVPIQVGAAGFPIRPNDIINAFTTAGGIGATVNVPGAAPVNVPTTSAWGRMVGGGFTFAELDPQPDGTQRLHIFMTETNDYNDVNRRAVTINTTDPDLDAALNMTPDPVIVSRNTNQIDDLFDGVTLDLLQAEPGTVVELDIQRDLGTVKQSIVDFVDAYNEVVRYGNLQRQEDPLTGEPVEEAVLFGTSVLSQTESLFELIGSQPADGVGLDFRALAEIGIEFASISVGEANPLESKTLVIDDSVLDNALLTNFDGVDRLFTQRIESNQARLSVQAFTDETLFTNANGIQLDFQPADLTGGLPSTGVYQLLDGAGVPTGTAFSYSIEPVSATNPITLLTEIVGARLTFDEGPATGLQMFYDGSDTDPAFPVGQEPSLTMSRGIGAHFEFGLDRLIVNEPSSDPGIAGKIGSMQAEINARTSDIELKQTRVNEQLERLEAERVRLIDQFNRMEAALAQLESLKQQVASAFGQTSSE